MSFTIGGTPIGSPQGPQDAANAREQSATKVVAQQQVMLVKDSLEVPLTKMQGPDDTHRFYYQTAENKPLLPMYLQVFLSRGDKEDVNWPKAFKELAGKLPNDLKAFLQRELKKPSSEQDESLQSIKKSLEFAAKGLDWLRGCKGVKVKVNDEERKKIEKAQTKESLDFYRQVLQASNAVAKKLPPLKREREFLIHMAMKIPLIISTVGSKREKVLSQLDFSRGEQVIVKEIDELKRYMDKNLADQRPLIASFLVDHLEVIHQLSYPGLNKQFYRMLWMQGQLFELDLSLMNRLLGPLQFLSEQIADSGTQLFTKEARIYIGELTLLFLFLFDRNEKKKDFTFFLGLTLLMGSTFLKTLGKRLMRALLIEEKAADWIYKAVLGTASGMLFVWMKSKKLHEKESGELFEAFKPLFVDTLVTTLSFFENQEGVEELRSFGMKLVLTLEQDDPDQFVDEVSRMLAKVGVNPLELEKTVKGLEEVSLTIQENLLASEKEKNRLAYSARSA